MNSLQQESIESGLFSNDLWSHQEKAVCEIENSFSSGIHAVCCQMPTGSGKSRVIRQIVENHSQSKKIIYIIAHRESLVNQLSNEVSEAGIRHGIIAAGRPYLRYRVQVCSMQTLVRRLDKIEEPDMLIIDEVHHAMAGSYLKIIQRYPDAKILGLTATPARLSGEPLSDIFQKLITGPQSFELIEKGILCPFDYYAPNDVDMSGVTKRAGEYNTSESDKRTDTKKIIGSVIGHYERLARGLPAIYCFSSINVAEHYAQAFREAGYRAIAVHSKMTGAQDKIDGLKNGTLDILCQVEMLSEGVDVKGAIVLGMVRPTASTVICLQQWGRVLRSAPGKEKAIIIDHVSNFERHGLPDDFREWSLDGKIKRQEGSEYKRCPKCQRPVNQTARECPYCGYIWQVEQVVQAIPEEAEGDLVKIADARTRRNSVVVAVARSAQNMHQACKIAQSSGYKYGYGVYIWKKILKKS